MHRAQHPVAAALEGHVPVGAEPWVRVECYQRAGHVVRVDAAEPDAGAVPTRVEQRCDERREVGSDVATVGPEVDAAENDLSMAGVDGGADSILHGACWNARRRAPRLPHDAVRAAMVTSVLRLDE